MAKIILLRGTNSKEEFDLITQNQTASGKVSKDTTPSKPNLSAEEYARRKDGSTSRTPTVSSNIVEYTRVVEVAAQFASRGGVVIIEVDANLCYTKNDSEDGYFINGDTPVVIKGSIKLDQLGQNARQTILTYWNQITTSGDSPLLG